MVVFHEVPVRPRVRVRPPVQRCLHRYAHRGAMVLATALVASLTVACGACSEEPPAPPPGDAGAQAELAAAPPSDSGEPAALPALPDDVPMPGAVYDQAYQRALE